MCMEHMFQYASSFNQPLNNWHICNVTNMSLMFNNAISFNQLLDNWDTSKISKFDNMFDHCPISEENKLKFEINY